MTTHTLESLEQSDPLYPWVATCSCHNPDGEGVGRADFGGDDPLDAVRAWQEHASQQPDALHFDRVVFDVDGYEVRIGPISEPIGGIATVFLQISLPDDDGTQITAWLTDDQWNLMRGVR